MTNLLFATVHATLDELLGDAKYLGACPGLIAALHTWSQTLVVHPHLHCLVTGGGLTDAGHWHPVRHGFLLPICVVMAVFRGKLLAAMDAAVQRGALMLPDGMPPQHWAILRNKLGRQKWNVHIRERYPHGTGVLTYLARYIRGGPLANQRLVSCTPEAVTMRYRLNGEHAGSPRQGLITFSIAEFIRRYLMHVPEPGTKVVRCYGLYAPSKCAALAVCRVQLGQEPVVQPPVLDWQTACQDRGDDHPERCPVCGRRLIRRGLILPASRPPPDARPGEAVACTAGEMYARVGRGSGLSSRARTSVRRPVGREPTPSRTPRLRSSMGCSGRSPRGTGEIRAVGLSINSIARACVTRCAGRPTRRETV